VFLQNLLGVFSQTGGLRVARDALDSQRAQNEELLRSTYSWLKRDAAPGVDGVA